jgi:hypothetical protein
MVARLERARLAWETQEKRPSVISWAEFLAINPEVPGSIPGATRFSEKQWFGARSTQPLEDNGGAT